LLVKNMFDEFKSKLIVVFLSFALSLELMNKK